VVTVKPTDDDAETVADGGSAGSAVDLFSQESSDPVEEGAFVTIRRMFMSYLYSPFMVAWNDWRP
jgi:hypothetical protein